VQPPGYWLAQCSPAWRDAIQVVAIDMCSIYASAVRRMLPAARLVVDLFHMVQLAVQMTGDVRRRVARARSGAAAGRRPGVLDQGPAGPQPGAPHHGPVRQGHGHPRPGHRRPRDPGRLDCKRSCVTY
jgi:hypothetical protein